MAASLDGFIARKDGRVDWLETSDEFAGGDTLDQEFVEAFLKTIDCYVMGSRTYETALRFEAQGLGGRTATNPPSSSLVAICHGPGITSSSTQAISRSS
jgi:dihydrofolate reductase